MLLKTLREGHKNEIEIQTHYPSEIFSLCSTKEKQNKILTRPFPRGIKTWAFGAGPWFTIGDPLKDMILK